MYDITHEDSFKNVKRWLTEIDKYARENVNKLLVGNKADLAEDGDPNKMRKVPFSKGKEFADSLEIPFLETSAKSGMRVDTAFLVMAHEIKTKMLNVTGNPRETLESKGDSVKKGGCC